jgi:ABC-2 type transport system permease protein
MREILAVVYREYLIRRTSPTWLFFDLAVPLLYLLMFGVAFDKALGHGLRIGDSIVPYNAFFLSGVLSMSCFGSAMNQSYGFFIDRDNGIFYEFLTYPMTRGQFLLGKIVFQCLMAVLQCVLTLAAGTLLLDIELRWHLLVFVFLGMMVGTAGWFFFLAIAAFRIRRNDTYNTVINVAYFVFMFLSSMFYPLDQVPPWLRAIAWVNPLTWQTDALRFLTIGLGSFSSFLLEIIGFGGFLVLAFWFAVRTLQRAV